MRKIFLICLCILITNAYALMAEDKGTDYIALARSYIKNKEYAKAVSALEEAVNVDPKIENIVALTQLYIYTNDPRCVEYYRLLKQKGYDRANMIYQMIFLSRFSSGLMTLTEDQLDIGWKAGDIPKDEKTLEYLKSANAYRTQDSYKKAIDVYERALKEFQFKDSEKAGIFYMIGMLYFMYRHNEEDVTKSISYVKNSYELFNSDAAKLSLLEIYSATGKNTEAAQFLSEGLEKNPQDKLLLYYQGLLYFANQNWAEAIKSWDKVREIDKILFALISDNYDKASKMP